MNPGKYEGQLIAVRCGSDPRKVGYEPGQIIGSSLLWGKTPQPIAPIGFAFGMSALAASHFFHLLICNPQVDSMSGAWVRLDDARPQLRRAQRRLLANRGLGGNIDFKDVRRGKPTTLRDEGRATENPPVHSSLTADPSSTRPPKTTKVSSSDFRYTGQTEEPRAMASSKSTSSPEDNSVMIALLGVTGAGKTTFARHASGNMTLKVGHSIYSCKQTDVREPPP